MLRCSTVNHQFVVEDDAIRAARVNQNRKTKTISWKALKMLRRAEGSCRFGLLIPLWVHHYRQHLHMHIVIIISAFIVSLLSVPSYQTCSKQTCIIMFLFTDTNLLEENNKKYQMLHEWHLYAQSRYIQYIVLPQALWNHMKQTNVTQCRAASSSTFLLYCEHLVDWAVRFHGNQRCSSS